MNELAPRPRSYRRGLTLAVGATVVSMLAACAPAASEPESSVPSGDAASLKDKVPAEWADGITVATQADIAPLTFTNDAGDIVGFDQDMLKALSDVLGVEISIEPVTFENLILGLESGKYDFVADTTIKQERLAKYDMVSYLTSSYSVATLADAEEIDSDVTALCGLSVGIVTGEVSADFITSEIDPQCADAGLEPVATTEYKDFATTTLSVQSGNVDAMFVDTMTFGYFQSEGPGEDFKFNGPTRLNESNSGYSFMKEQGGELATVVHEAIQTLIDNGVYEEILGTYGLTESGVTESVVNPEASI